MKLRSLAQRKARFGSLWTALLVLPALLLAGCGAQTHAKKAGPPQPLVIVANTGGDLVQNFNPFNTSVNSYGEWGPVYETLMFFNRASGSVKPWLADSSTFSSDATQITFKLHPGIKWTDGQAFTASDVAFTLNLIKQYPAIDNNGIGGSIQQAAASDPQTVVVTLTAPNSSILWFLAGQTWIVPQHIWSTVGDPSKYTNPTPVGTGPYIFKSFTPQLIDFVKNPNYWQPGKPVVPEIRYPAFNGNTTAELAMNNDQTDWNGLYTPNVQKTFIGRDTAHNHYYFAPSDPVMLFLNLKKAPFDQLAVRQAISDAIDRSKISSVGESGYEPVAHPTGLILPAAKDYLDPNYAGSSFALDTTRATQLLTTAGFKKGTDGILVGPNGKKLAVNLDVVTGYTDWISDCQIIAANLQTIGIQVNITQDQFDTFYQNLQNGSYDMSIWGETPGPTPYYIYDEVLASANSAPIGQAANTNFERWTDNATDTLLNQYNSTVDPTQQKQAIYGLEKIVVEQVPVIFLMNEPYWYEYNTLKYDGWPDQTNLYAESSPYTYPDDEIVLLNLHQ